MTKAFDSIRQGLTEAIGFAQGKQAGARVHQVEVPTVDVAAVRTRTDLSQAAFARSIGVAKGTLLNWEHGRRRPTGPAQVLLAMIAKRPSLVGSCGSRDAAGGLFDFGYLVNCHRNLNNIALK